MAQIVIAGGGIMGSCIAYYLALAGAASAVTVLEPDPAYEFAATPRAVGAIRLQHGLRENVEMSIYGDQVYSAFAEHVRGGKIEFDPQFRRCGYMYQVHGTEGIAALEANVRMQREVGVEVQLLDADELRRRYPSFRFVGVDCAALSLADGQIDPYAALMGFRRAAEGLGVTYIQDRLVALDLSGTLVTDAYLASGLSLPVDTLVNAANCWASEICAMVGMSVPIEPMRRQQFYFLTQQRIEPIPAMRRMDGPGVRMHQDGYLSGFTNHQQPSGLNWDLELEMFETVLWPQLADQCDAFEAIKLKGGWVGHYDMNRLDNNPIIDRFDKVSNFILAAGFSGHGLMHAPAVGRAVKELILDGGFRSIDLSRLSWRRVMDGHALRVTD
ncbi:FAD-binding oxidoreductase [Bradyrhizobium sp. LHD-71]|uniref:NAD(P)/FAD-dependent oxidoreductase n=1 Tax=Bradyrhizobium sp. LHD-71 TaxID=3072141 RepID=UPI00280CE88A|nr:FAD-binding oxidoreductase [Bradyrhizobium sp. LHD-71]MDQ8731099.1 FAD-binding oxidoreductase [Bradyrhizobium sp. LHD-71]